METIYIPSSLSGRFTRFLVMVRLVGERVGMQVSFIVVHTNTLNILWPVFEKMQLCCCFTEVGSHIIPTIKYYCAFNQHATILLKNTIP